jgi:hypothetical protein
MVYIQQTTRKGKGIGKDLFQSQLPGMFVDRQHEQRF